MRYGLLLALTVLSACARPTAVSELKNGGNQTGQFRGVIAIDDVLRERVIGPKSPSFSIGQFFGEYQPQPQGLTGLLGMFSGSGGGSTFLNGDPNAVNMLLYKVAMTKLSEAVARAAAGSEIHDFSLNQNLLKLLEPIAKDWPKETVRNDATLMQVWFAVMGYEPPEEEYLAWRDYFLGASCPYVSQSGEAAVVALLQTMLLNPYFLLQT